MRRTLSALIILTQIIHTKPTQMFIFTTIRNKDVLYSRNFETSIANIRMTFLVLRPARFARLGFPSLLTVAYWIL